MPQLLVTHNAKAVDCAKTSVHKVFKVKRLQKGRRKVERVAPIQSTKEKKKEVNKILAVLRLLIYHARAMESAGQQSRMTLQSNVMKP